jgi:CheY-like chemotaxis protein
MIYLPLVAQPEPSGPRPAAPDPVARGCETILLAEDEDSVRTLVATYLADLGYRVLPAPNGAAALEVARGHSGTVNLLLSDFVMPKLGGRELASELRKADPGLKVIFMSGYAGHGVAARDLDLPDAYFLPKPLSLPLLAKTVREALDRVAG